MTKQELDALWAQAEAINPANDPYREGYCDSDRLRYQEALDKWAQALHAFHATKEKSCSTATTTL